MSRLLTKFQCLFKLFLLFCYFDKQMLCNRIPLNQFFDNCNRLLYQMRRFDRKCYPTDTEDHCKILFPLTFEKKKRIQEIDSPKFMESVAKAGVKTILNVGIIRNQAQSCLQAQVLISESQKENEALASSFEVIKKEAESFVEQAPTHKTLKLLQVYFRSKNKEIL